MFGMDFENKVLSEVHINTACDEVEGDGASYTVSRFLYKIHQEPSHSPRDRTISMETGDATSCSTEADEDGDLIVSRRKPEVKDDMEVITIEHSLATHLADVGQQVWQGALLLCDFLLAEPLPVEGAVVLDLGAGVGLTSLVAARHASHVFCTDHGTAVLDMAWRNVERNRGLLGSESDCRVQVRELDWFWDWQPGHFPSTPHDVPQQFTWTETDLNTLEKISVIIASEAVYDYDLTDAFFRTLHYFLCKGPKTAYIALEKRIVFSATELSVCSPGYEQFCENLETLADLETELLISFSQLSTDFPQAFSYHRHKHLELWKVESRLKPSG